MKVLKAKNSPKTSQAEEIQTIFNRLRSTDLNPKTAAAVTRKTKSAAAVEHLPHIFISQVKDYGETVEQEEE